MRKPITPPTALCVFLLLSSGVAHAQETKDSRTDRSREVVPRHSRFYDYVDRLQKEGGVISVWNDGNLNSAVSRYDFAVGIARDLERRQSPRWAVENKEYHLSSPLILSLLRRLAEEFAPELKDFGFSMPDVYARLATPEPFPNVPPHHWARASVETLRKAGILVGDSSGKF